MDVEYSDSKLEKLCTNEREMKKKRSDIAAKLPLRIKALETAKSVDELVTHDPLGYWHPLTADLNGLWAGRLSGNWRLLVEPETEEGVEPAEATSVLVIDIDDYHS